MNIEGNGPDVNGPAPLYLGASTESGLLLKRIFGSLGAASYALYVVHEPMLVLA